MKIKLGSVVAAASGSVGGCVYSHNRYGAYVRQRSVPVNPGSVQQGAVRSAFSGLATAWNVDLDQSERDAWDAYAAGVPRIDALGQATYILGLNWFIAVNTLRIQSGLDRLDAAPILLNHTDLSPVALADFTPPSTASVSFNTADEWATALGGFLHISLSRAMNETRLFFKGPFRFAAIVAGAVVPPSSPESVTAPFAAAVGQRLYLRAIACSDDGRLSVPQIQTLIVPT